MNPILVTGATGQFGAYIVRELNRLSLPFDAWGHSRTDAIPGLPVRSVDLLDSVAVAANFGSPAVVIHAAAIASVAECAKDPARAKNVNVDGTARLVELAAKKNSRLVFVSTDLVFDGENAPYDETAAPCPLSDYGRTKAAAEQVVLANPMNCVLRVSLMYGRSLIGMKGFFEEQIKAIRERRPIVLFEDEWRTPLHAENAARAAVALGSSTVLGLLHVGGPKRMSRLEMGHSIANALGLDTSCIVASTRQAAGQADTRPKDTSLDSSRFQAIFPDIRFQAFEKCL